MVFHMHGYLSTFVAVVTGPGMISRLGTLVVALVSNANLGSFLLLLSTVQHLV